ncbi:hypothetical protein KP509_10G008100 [Ceratopteris richardii]|uniref:Glycosyltransferase subfamily 4-like N-terminal domain-containing protein n=1 Tax=Ceratopteris richardii TaxID=49495 RepID=A0A8T2TYF0_CERRI|nr:hypothetical protein KP509_10G008100 [Ceratopteris richardii]
MQSVRFRFLLLCSITFILCSMLTILHFVGLPSFVTAAVPSVCLLSKHNYPQNAATFHGDLRLFSQAWNQLSFSWLSSSPPVLLRVALFVKVWPFSAAPGGLERHAQTLHRHLADRGHEIHVFTTDRVSATINEWQEGCCLFFHVFPPTARGFFDVGPAWRTFLSLNASSPFDIVHSESVALPAVKAKLVGGGVVVSWHGVAYETIQSDIVQEVLRRQDGETQPDLKLERALSHRTHRVVEEIGWFHRYAHHVATSDYAGEVLETIYQIPHHRLHIIVNGVDEQRFRLDYAGGRRFGQLHGLPKKGLVLGAAGRLVKDKGYALLFRAFSLFLLEQPSVTLVLAGDGPWGERFRELQSRNVIVLGSLTAEQLALFYNAIDVFVNPTLRAQGLDHTLVEAMLCGRPVLATHFSSIVRSLRLQEEELGYTFAPNVPSLLAAMRIAVRDGRDVLRRKGRGCYERASLLYTATKMASAYERLFMCVTNSTYCMYY